MKNEKDSEDMVGAGKRARKGRPPKSRKNIHKNRTRKRKVLKQSWTAED